jgi:hypothetical protein
MKTQRFFVVADDGEHLDLLTWAGSIEDARNYAQTAATARPSATIVISQGISSVCVETKLKWSDQCATSPASSPQSCG